jgi:hypothetical protein
MADNRPIRADELESSLRPMSPRPHAATLASMNPLAIYFILVGIAIAVAVAAMVFARPIQRVCPGCDADVRLDARACGGCGYRFT